MGHSWAKRTIIQNVIRKLKPRPNLACSSSFKVNIVELRIGEEGQFELEAVLELEDFERFVYVITVLQRYSAHDCALLLGCTHRQIEDARSQAIAHLMGQR